MDRGPSSSRRFDTFDTNANDFVSQFYRPGFMFSNASWLVVVTDGDSRGHLQLSDLLLLLSVLGLHGLKAQPPVSLLLGDPLPDHLEQVVTTRTSADFSVPACRVFPDHLIDLIKT